MHDEDRINTQPNQQRENIDHLPVRRAPEGMINNRSGNGGNRGGGRRN
jgi:hypothetical protein